MVVIMAGFDEFSTASEIEKALTAEDAVDSMEQDYRASGDEGREKKFQKPEPFREALASKAVDGKVAVIGRFNKIGSFEGMLSDGSGSIKASFAPEHGEKLKEGAMLRVLGELKSGRLEARFVQSFDGFDLEAFKTLHSLV